MILGTQFRRDLLGTAMLALPLAAIAIASATIGDGALTKTVITFFVSLIAVVRIGVYSGNSGIVSFGHVAFMALGGYLSALLTIAPDDKAKMLPNLPAFVGHAQLEFLPAASVGILFVGIVAAVVGLIIARLEGAAASIATLGLLVIVNSLIVGARDVTRGSRALYGIPLLVGTWTAFGFAIVAVLAARLFRGSRAGLELRAARAVGVHVARRPLKIAGGD